MDENLLHGHLSHSAAGKPQLPERQISFAEDADFRAVWVIRPVDLRIPEPASDEDILRAHDPEYVRRLLNGELSAKEIRRVGLPWSAGNCAAGALFGRGNHRSLPGGIS